MQPELPQDPKKLSQNGILYLSSGFTGPYTLQIIACRKLSPTQYQLCLTDGQLYIGGNYVNADPIELDVYALVAVQGRFMSRWRPMEIFKLEVVDYGVGGMLGKAPVTLHDYFIENKQANLNLNQCSQSQTQRLPKSKPHQPQPNPNPTHPLQPQPKSSPQSSPSLQPSPSPSQSPSSSQLQLPQQKPHAIIQPILQQLPNHNTEIQAQQPVCEVISSSLEEVMGPVEIKVENQRVGKESREGKGGEDGHSKKYYQVKSSDSQFVSSFSEISELPSSYISTLPKKAVQNQLIKNESNSNSNIIQNTIPKYIPHPQSHPQSQPRVYISHQHQIHITPTSLLHQTHNTFISQLYERMPRWKILCRIIHLRTFISARGKKCSIFHLIDQKGDSIKCVYYYGRVGGHGGNGMGMGALAGLEEGRVCSFAGGEVVVARGADNGDLGNLEIVFDSKCQIKQFKQIFIYPFSSKKLTKFSQLKQNLQSHISLLGILKSYQIIRNLSSSQQPLSLSQSQSQSTTKQKIAESDRPKLKIKCIICDPVERLEIQFSKILYPGEKEPVVGRVCVAVGFVVVGVDNAVRLNGVADSYLVAISEEDIQYNGALNHPQSKHLKQLQKYLPPNPTNPTNPSPPILNLSKPIYTTRQISTLKSLLPQTESPIYSELLISIIDIKIKKQYRACPICKRATILQELTLYQCLKCRKIVDAVLTYIVRVVVADDTGSLEMDVIGEKVEVVIGVEVGEFGGLGDEDKECTLQIAKFSQFVIRVRTEKKGFKEVVHTLQEIEKQEHTLSMKQIRRRTVEKKLKLQQQWCDPDF